MHIKINRMNRILFLLLIILSVNASAQKASKHGLQCTRMILNIASDYKYVDTDTLINAFGNKDSFRQKFLNSDGDSLFIYYNTVLQKADADLKMPGDSNYILRAIAGQYLTIKKIYALYGGTGDFKSGIGTNWHFMIDDKDEVLDIFKSDIPGYWILRI